MGRTKTKDLPGMTGPGVADTRIKEIDDTIEEYEDIKDKRITLTEKETETRTAVMGAMRKHGKNKYRYDSKLFVLDDKLKVQKIKEPKDK